MGQSCSGDGLSKASEELDVQVELLEEKIAKQDAAIRHWIAQTDPMAKQRAMQAMKKKKKKTLSCRYVAIRSHFGSRGRLNQPAHSLQPRGLFPQFVVLP
mmetsp:Transcript_13466/g.10769  ORF Transcript_13466/g.10769 Transcript_13466/m.10769 type:complete len:100 (-) Transcript_13466:139-438(-)